MYCIVKYSEVDKKDYDSKEKLKEKQKDKDKEKEKGKVKERSSKQSDESKVSVQKSTSQKSEEIPHIRYEDQVKELLINPNCITKLLLDFVYESLEIEKDAEIDFCDESGRLANIGSLKNWEYSTEVLKPQCTYIVIAFQRSKAGKYKSIRPILTKNCKLYCELVNHLRSQFSSSSIYISDKSSSSKSFGRPRAGSKASVKSGDKNRIASEQSKSSDPLRKSWRRSSLGSNVQFGGKSSKNTLRSYRSTKSAQALLGLDSEVEIKPKKLQSRERSLIKTKQAKKSPK